MYTATDWLESQRGVANDALKSALADTADLPIYGMLRYFMGYEDQHLKPIEGAAGKRIRSSLLLGTAEMLGGAKGATDLAVAVELFHNFTLIHDDIEDNDELRRGRPTVWKLWGIDHGINAGDAQAFLTTKHLLRAASSDEAGARAAEELNSHFQQVIEGQYLDFELTKKPLSDSDVTEEAYLEMIRKKTSVLIGTAAAAGGVAAGCDINTRDLLFAYGESFGMAYQIADDMSSIWGDVARTGKRAGGDLAERKKTYPVLHARGHSSNPRLKELYTGTAPLADTDVQELIDIVTDSGAIEATRAVGESYVAKATEAAGALPVSDTERKMLGQLVQTLVRFSPEQHASD